MELSKERHLEQYCNQSGEHFDLFWQNWAGARSMFADYWLFIVTAKHASWTDNSFMVTVAKKTFSDFHSAKSALYMLARNAIHVKIDNINKDGQVLLPLQPHIGVSII